MVRIVTDRHQDLSQRTVHQVLLKLVLNPKPVTIAKVHLVNGVAGVRGKVEVDVGARNTRTERGLIVYLKMLQMAETGVHILMVILRKKQSQNIIDVTEFWILIKIINI
jgi:hypothetical protein